MKPAAEPALTWLSLPGAPESLDPLRNFVLAQALAAGLDEALRARIDLVVEEVLLNIFHYAFDKGQAGTVAVGCGKAPEGEFLMRVIDPGRPFNPLAQPPPDLSLDIADRNIGGLGILLARQMSSAMTYRRRDDQNILDILFASR